MFLRAFLPYGVSKLNSARSAPEAARRSPLVNAPEDNNAWISFCVIDNFDIVY